MSKTSSPKTKKTSKSNATRSAGTSWRTNRILQAVLLIIFAAVGAYFIYQSSAAPKNQPAVTLSLSPSSQRVSIGETLAVAIKLNTNGQNVNAVQANLTYPVNNFEFVSVDSTGSAFEIAAEATGGSGRVTIAKGNITYVNSISAHVATVNLRAIGSGRKVQVRFADDSQVLGQTDGLNILQRKVGGSYTVQ